MQQPGTSASDDQGTDQALLASILHHMMGSMPCVGFVCVVSGPHIYYAYSESWAIPIDCCICMNHPSIVKGIAFDLILVKVPTMPIVMPTTVLLYAIKGHCHLTTISNAQQAPMHTTSNNCIR